MALSAQVLDNEVEELQTLCPKLAPQICPQGWDTEDLHGLAETEGKPGQQLLQKALTKASKSPQAQQCCLCGLSSEATASGRVQEDEATALRFTVNSQISFREKAVTLCKAGFACGRCRALTDGQQLLRFSATKLGPAHPERQAQFQELCSHFARVNGLDRQLQGNDDAMAVWVQEVFCKAYSLQVVASNIAGWQLLGPSGQPICRAGAPGSAARLAQQLLELQQPASKTPSSRTPGASAKKVKKAQQKDEEQADQDGDAADAARVPPAKTKALKRGPSAAAQAPPASAGAAGQAGPSPKKQKLKEGAAAGGAGAGGSGKAKPSAKGQGQQQGGAAGAAGKGKGLGAKAAVAAAKPAATKPAPSKPGASASEQLPLAMKKKKTKAALKSK